MGVWAGQTSIDGDTNTEMKSVGSSALCLLFHWQGTGSLLLVTAYPSPCKEKGDPLPM